MVSKLLKEAAEKLKKSESPMLDARVLLAKAMDRENSALIFDMPDEKQLALFNEYIKKRNNDTCSSISSKSSANGTPKIRFTTIPAIPI